MPRVILVCLHMVLVAAGAAHLRLIPDHYAAGRALRWYGEASGANNNFGFFAPAVASQVRATCTVDEGARRTEFDCLHSASAEITLRYHTLLTFFSVEEAQDLLARSWAARSFGLHPEARTVIVTVSVYNLPTMREYQRGKRPTWNRFYRATFERTRHPKEAA